MIEDPTHRPLVLANSQRFRALVAESHLSQATAMTLFNRGRSQPVTESGWKSWLADPASERWAAISDADLQHAASVFSVLSVLETSPAHTPAADVQAADTASACEA